MQPTSSQITKYPMLAAALYFSIVCTQWIKNNKSGYPHCINHPQRRSVAGRGRSSHFKKAAEQITDIDTGNQAQQYPGAVSHNPLQNIKEERHAAKINADALPKCFSIDAIRQGKYDQCGA